MTICESGGGRGGAATCEVKEDMGGRGIIQGSEQNRTEIKKQTKVEEPRLTCTHMKTAKKEILAERRKYLV